jgi:hypothetical protein
LFSFCAKATKEGNKAVSKKNFRSFICQTYEIYTFSLNF